VVYHQLTMNIEFNQKEIKGGVFNLYIAFTITVTLFKIRGHRKLTLLSNTFQEPFSLQTYFELGFTLIKGAILISLHNKVSDSILLLV
jgi:hypothetical protein